MRLKLSPLETELTAGFEVDGQFVDRAGSVYDSIVYLVQSFFKQFPHLDLTVKDPSGILDSAETTGFHNAELSWPVKRNGHGGGYVSGRIFRSQKRIYSDPKFETESRSIRIKEWAEIYFNLVRPDLANSAELKSKRIEFRNMFIEYASQRGHSVQKNIPSRS